MILAEVIAVANGIKKMQEKDKERQRELVDINARKRHEQGQRLREIFDSLKSLSER